MAQGTIAVADVRNGGNPDHFKYGANGKDCIGCVGGEATMISRCWQTTEIKEAAGGIVEERCLVILG